MSQLLLAFEGKNTTVPVWFMRQAGRFLPEYRKIREKHTLDEMFRDPEIVSEVTCLPVSILNVDAAILFADILTLPMGLGFQITFDPQKGPVIKNPLKNEKDIKNFHDLNDIPHIRESIGLINKELTAAVPLIGFAGAPFTVLCYLIEGGSSKTFSNVYKWIKGNPKSFHDLMNFLTRNTIAYLNLQKKAGIKVFQLFDSWGGILSKEDYEIFILPYVQKIFNEVDLASIYFLKNSLPFIAQMQKSGSDFISVCETVNFGDQKILKNSDIGVQGNLFQGLLTGPNEDIKKATLKILDDSKRFKKYIFNLSHGITPDVPVENVKMIVELVHTFKR